MDNIKERVRKYLFDNYLMGGYPDRVTDCASFMEMGIIDSTGVLELVSFLEKTYNIHVEDAEMTPENLDTLNGIENYVRRKLS